MDVNLTTNQKETTVESRVIASKTLALLPQGMQSSVTVVSHVHVCMYPVRVHEYTGAHIPHLP